MKNIFIECITEGEFATIRDAWNALLERSVTNEVFLSWEWMFSWWDAYKDEHKQLLILIGRDYQGNLIGIAPFYIEKNRYFGMKSRRVVRFCSSIETYADHLDILCEKDFEQSFPKAVINYFQEQNSIWDVISLEGIKEDSITKRYLVSKKDDLKHLIIDCEAQSECPYLTINESFEEYLKSFSGKTRNTLLRKRKNLLEKEKYEFHILNSDSDEPEKYMRELFSLHAERAKRKKIPTVFSGKKTYHFHNNLVSHLLKGNKIVIAFLSKGSTILALYYCLRSSNKYYYYQTGISKQGEQKSAGTVLLSLILEQAFNEGCSEFDFLRGNEEYKYFWTQNARRNYMLFIRKNTVFNEVTHYLSHTLLKPGKKMIKYHVLPTGTKIKKLVAEKRSKKILGEA